MFFQLLINLIKSIVIKMDNHCLLIMSLCLSETKLNTWNCSNSSISTPLKIWSYLVLINIPWNSYSLFVFNSQMFTLKWLMLKEKTNFLKYMVNNLRKRFFPNIQKEIWNFISKLIHKLNPLIKFKEKRSNHKTLNLKIKNILIRRFEILFLLQLDQKEIKLKWKEIVLLFSQANIKAIL